jgi:hypothetical protein
MIPGNGSNKGFLVHDIGELTRFEPSKVAHFLNESSLTQDSRD